MPAAAVASASQSASSNRNAYQWPLPPSSVRHWTASWAEVLEASESRIREVAIVEFVRVVVIVFLVFFGAW